MRRRMSVARISRMQILTGSRLFIYFFLLSVSIFSDTGQLPGEKVPRHPLSSLFVVVVHSSHPFIIRLQFGLYLFWGLPHHSLLFLLNHTFPLSLLLTHNPTTLPMIPLFLSNSFTLWLFFFTHTISYTHLPIYSSQFIIIFSFSRLFVFCFSVQFSSPSLFFLLSSPFNFCYSSLV